MIIWRDIYKLRVIFVLYRYFHLYLPVRTIAVNILRLIFRTLQSTTIWLLWA